MRPGTQRSAKPVLTQRSRLIGHISELMGSRSEDLFVNCPFDTPYQPSFRALVFAVIRCGFQIRCALELSDSSETRIDKLYRIIEQSQLGIHDISRTELDSSTGLPRFNMPLELGMFLGAKRFGDSVQKKKKCLIIDTDPHRFSKFISDLAGMDIESHGGDARQIVSCTRDWLVTVSPRRSIPPTVSILDSFDRFTSELPAFAAAAGLVADKLIYPDFVRLCVVWLKAESKRGAASP